MISKKLEEAINDQINAEFYSAYLYLSMAAYFDDMNLKGFANWTRVQAQEETYHALKFFDYLAERGGRAILQAIKEPPNKWESPLDVFEEIYKHECYVTERINNLVKLAKEKNDNAAEIFLQWYVTEQVEEEASANEIVKKLKLIGDNPNALLLLDSQLATRVFTPPTTTK